MDRISFRAMGCAISAAVEATDARSLAAVPRWFAAWERRLSRFSPESELCRLNAGAGTPTRVSPTMARALGAALVAARATDGLVIPTALAALERAGYDLSFEHIARRVPTSDGAASGPPRRVVGPRAGGCAIDGVAFHPGERTLTLRAGTRLDLGGTVKGWAADRAVARLARHGAALVDAGGDIAISGPREGGEPWLIAVADPMDPDADLAVLHVTRGGVATSGRDHRRWWREGRWQHHIIDPRTERPADTDVVSATVVGPSALMAEVAAKVVVIRGSQDGLAWIDAHAELAALVVLDDGALLGSRRLDAVLEWPLGVRLRANEESVALGS